MLTPLPMATAATCGGKAAALATLLAAGLPVPDGVVLPFSAQSAALGAAESAGVLRRELTAALTAMGDPPVAVRSSAAHEDTAEASAAGQYESVLGVRGTAAVEAAVRRCWAAASRAQVAEYWRDLTGDPLAAPEIAVIIQRMVAADASGVMFTPMAAGAPTRIEASWGLGPAVVGGTVTPDTWEVGVDGSIHCVLGQKSSRVDTDPDQHGLRTAAVPAHQQHASAIDEHTATTLARLGQRAATVLGGPQDLEWAIAAGHVWLLQSRPITAPVPELPSADRPADTEQLSGTPGAHGRHTGPARVLLSAAELDRLQPGEIVVCRYTDPSWTPAFRIAGGIVTEAGGVLSHAAIVAREHRLPAVLGVAQATTAIPDGCTLTIDGSHGTITLPPR